MENYADRMGARKGRKRLDWYETWFYQGVVNAPWFIWGAVLMIFGANFIMPAVLWLMMSGKKIRIRKWAKKLADRNAEGPSRG